MKIVPSKSRHQESAQVSRKQEIRVIDEIWTHIPEKQMIFRLVPMLDASTGMLDIGTLRDLTSTAGGVIADGAMVGSRVCESSGTEGTVEVEKTLKGDADCFLTRKTYALKRADGLIYHEPISGIVLMPGPNLALGKATLIIA